VTREKFRYATDRLVEILQNNPEDEDAIEAAKNLAMLDLALLKAEIGFATRSEISSHTVPSEKTVRHSSFTLEPAQFR
jgi:hypothetical protein